VGLGGEKSKKRRVTCRNLYIYIYTYIYIHIYIYIYMRKLHKSPRGVADEVFCSLFSSFFVGVCVVFCSRLRVRDHDETFGIRREMLLEPHTRLEIEMIRRLVKQQHLQ